MSITFRRAVQEEVGLILGLIGPSGSGKTFSAMRLASGLSAGKPFAVIDTEAGRAKHYAQFFTFDHADLMPPFRPAAYAEAIKAADEAKYPVIVVDSCSHEHAGEGGLLDWHEEELQRMAGDDWKRRDACKMAAWIAPKLSHKQMVQRLLQVRAHLILCFRAEERIEMSKGSDGKMQIIPRGWVPVCEKTLPYELTASFLLTPDAPGYPRPIKLQEQHKGMFDLQAPLDEKAGEALAAWATGGSPIERDNGDAASPPGPPIAGPVSDLTTLIGDYRRAFEQATTIRDLTAKANQMEMDPDLTTAQKQGLRLALQDHLKALSPPRKGSK